MWTVRIDGVHWEVTPIIRYIKRGKTLVLQQFHKEISGTRERWFDVPTADSE